MVVFIWLALIVLGIFIEVASPQLVSTWFVLGAVAALIAHFCGAPIWLQVLIGIGVSLVAMAAIKPFAQKLMDKRATAEKARRCVGRDGIVTRAVGGKNGRVTVQGTNWAAVAASGGKIPKGVKILVEDADEATLIVRPMQ